MNEFVTNFIDKLDDWRIDLNYGRRRHPIGFWLLLPVWAPLYCVWLAACIAHDIAA